MCQYCLSDVIGYCHTFDTGIAEVACFLLFRKEVQIRKTQITDSPSDMHDRLTLAANVFSVQTKVERCLMAPT